MTRACARGPTRHLFALGLVVAGPGGCGLGGPPPLRAAPAVVTADDGDDGGGWTDVPAPPWPSPAGGATAEGTSEARPSTGAGAGAGTSDGPDSGAVSGDTAGPAPSESDSDSGSDSDSDSGGASGEPAPSLVGLRLVEVLPNPDGTDGAAQTPEWVALQNTASEPLPLIGLEIAARGWPAISAADLGVEGLELAPGELLIVQRWASAADVPTDLPHASGPATGPAWWTGTGGSGGLRNTDGAVQLADAYGPLELLVYGGPSPEPPWDDPSGWPGAPVAAPASGRSLCADLTAAPGEASGWLDCAPGSTWGAGG